MARGLWRMDNSDGAGHGKPLARRSDAGLSRRLGVARRLCWTMAAAAALGGALLWFDARWHLTGWLRGVALAAWWTMLLVLLWRAVFQSQEQGWSRTREVVANLTAAVVAALALGVTAVVLLSWADVPYYARRLFLPWSDARGPLPYRIVVTTGDAAVPIGQRLTVCGYIEPLSESAPWPPQAWLVWEEQSGGAIQRIPMRVEDNGTLHAMLQANNDFRYRVEVANAASDWYSIVTIEPVQLLAESAVVAEPPTYAGRLSPRRYPLPETEGWKQPVPLWQHGSLEVQALFSRPVVAAYVEWRCGEDQPVEVLPLLLDEQRQRGTVRWNVINGGRFRLTAVVERQGRRWTSHWHGNVEIIPDQPPRWLEVSGLVPVPRRVPPGAVLPIRFRIRDDFGIESVVLEYSSERQPWPESLPVVCRSHDDGVMEGECSFLIDERYREGDVVRLRLRVRDNRWVEQVGSSPQEATFPLQNWCELRVDRTAPSLQEQNIQAQQLWLGTAAAAARQRLATLEQSLRRVQQEAERTGWQEHHRVLIRQAIEQLREGSQVWSSLRQEVEVMPELCSLLGPVRTIQSAAEELTRQAESWTEFLAPKQRQDFLRQWRTNLQAVEPLLAMLEKRNAQLAMARRQAWQLEQLASRLEILAVQIEAATNPRTYETVRQQWERWLRDWHQWWESEGDLRLAWEYVLRRDLHALRLRGGEHHDMLLRLAEAEDAVRRIAHELFLQTQQAWGLVLLRHAERLEYQRQLQPRLQDVPPLRLEPWYETIAALERGELLVALIHQEQAIREAERQAAALMPHDVALAQHWQQLVRRCQRQRSILAAFRDEELRFLHAPLAWLPANLLPRLQRCAEAARHLLPEQGRLQTTEVPCQLAWLAVELQQTALSWQEGNWPSAVAAMASARLWLELAWVTSAGEPRRLAALEALRRECREIGRWQFLFADSPALALLQQQAACLHWIDQVREWLQRWETLVRTTPPSLVTDHTRQMHAIERCRTALEAYRTSIVQKQRGNLTVPLRSLAQYQTLQQRLKEALEMLPSSAPMLPSPLVDDATLLACLEQLRQATDLILQPLPDGAEGRLKADRYRFIAKLFRQAARQRLSFPSSTP